MNTNKETRQTGYLIATCKSAPDLTRILAEKIPVPFDKFDFKSFNLDFSDFVGSGWEIDLYTPTAEPESFENSIISVEQNGNRQNYRLEECGQRFPLIEGALVPGIYFLDGEGYFALSDNKDLTMMLNSFYNREITGEMKFVCHPNSIIWFESASGELLETLDHYTFNYFDLYCPLCRQKVIGFQTEGGDERRGDSVEDGCLHYLGLAVPIYGKYDEEEFEHLGVESRFINGKMHLKTVDGKWEQTVVYEPAELVNSYWNEFDSDSIFANHFLFSPSGNVRRMKNKIVKSI